MLQYDGFYYARHETINAGDVKAQTSQKPTRQELISGFRTMKQAYEYCYSPLDGIPLHGAIDEKKRVFYVSGKLPT